MTAPDVIPVIRDHGTSDLVPPFADPMARCNRQFKYFTA